MLPFQKQQLSDHQKRQQYATQQAQAVFNAIQQHPGLNSIELAKVSGVSVSRVREALRKLQGMKLGDRPLIAAEWCSRNNVYLWSTTIAFPVVVSQIEQSGGNWSGLKRKKISSRLVEDDRIVRHPRLMQMPDAVAEEAIEWLDGAG